MRPFLFIVLLFVVGCASANIKPRARQSQTTVAVVASKSALLAIGIHDNAAARIRQGLLDKNVGIPVVDGAPADMTLRLNVTGANTTHATSYEWQLIDNTTHQIVVQKSESSLFGHSGSGISDTVLAELVKLDLAPFNKSRRGAMPTIVNRENFVVPSSNMDGAKSWAVVIGVSEYRNQVSPADYADADAELFAQFAKTTLGIPDKQIKTLLNDRASRSDIAGALFEWLPKNAKDADRVYVFFSGHGSPHLETGDAYLVPYDADPKYLKSGGLAVSEVQSALAKLDGVQTFLFLDACFSGSGSRSALAKGTRPIVPVKETQSHGVVTITASAASEATGLSANGNQGLFTFYLLKGLSGDADGNRDSSVSLQELQTYVTEQVAKDARQDNREQTPTFAIPQTVGPSTALVSGLKSP